MRGGQKRSKYGGIESPAKRFNSLRKFWDGKASNGVSAENSLTFLKDATHPPWTKDNLDSEKT